MKPNNSSVSLPSHQSSKSSFIEFICSSVPRGVIEVFYFIKGKHSSVLCHHAAILSLCKYINIYLCIYNKIFSHQSSKSSILLPLSIT